MFQSPALSFHVTIASPPVAVVDTNTARAKDPATKTDTIVMPSSLHLFLSNATVTPRKRNAYVQTNSKEKKVHL